MSFRSLKKGIIMVKALNKGQHTEAALVQSIHIAIHIMIRWWVRSLATWSWMSRSSSQRTFTRSTSTASPIEPGKHPLRLIRMSQTIKLFSWISHRPLLQPRVLPFRSKTRSAHTTESRSSRTTSNTLLADIAQLRTSLTSLLTDGSDASPSHAPPFSPHHIPSPPNRLITSLALGDSHWHALHPDGTIASLGSDPSGRGCLGLGGPTIAPF